MNVSAGEGAFANMPPLRPGEALVRRGLVALMDDSGERPEAMLVTDQRVVLVSTRPTETALVFSAGLSNVRFGWPTDTGPDDEYLVVDGSATGTKQAVRLRRHADAPGDAMALFEAIHDAQREATPGEPPAPRRWLRLTGWARRSR